MSVNMLTYMAPSDDRLDSQLPSDVTAQEVVIDSHVTLVKATSRILLTSNGRR